MRKITLLMALLLAGIGGFAQSPIQYGFEATTGTYTELPLPTVLGSATGNGGAASLDDVNYRVAFPAGFTFSFAGTAQTNLNVNTNGYVGFSTAAWTSATNYTPLSSNTTGGTNAGVISAFASDLNAFSSATATPGSLSWQVLGAGDDEVFVVQYKNFKPYEDAATAGKLLNFQIHLYESTHATKPNHVEIVYGNNTAGNAALTGVDVGIRGAAVGWAANVNSVMIDNIPAGNTCNWLNVVTANNNENGMYFNAANASIAIPNGLTYRWYPQGATAPAPVRTFAATTATATTATITWTAPAGATQYNVQYREPHQCAWTNFSGNPVTGTTATLTGLTAGRVYQVRVQASNGTVNSIWSHIPNTAGGGNGYTVNGTVTTTVTCFAPTALVAAPQAGGISAALLWTAPSSVPADGYQYYISASSAAPSPDATATGVSTTTATVAGNLSADTVYYVWVRSSCGNGDYSAWSTSATFRTECSSVTLPSATAETFTGFTGAMPAPSCWREATGVLGGTPAALTQAGGSTWGNSNYNNSASHPNGNAVMINLYGTDKDWFISPSIDLGDGSTDYQLEYNASVIPWSGTAIVTDMGEKFVKVVISTDNGATWSDANVLKTYGNGNIPANGIADIVSLASYSGIIKIGFYAYSTTNAQDLRFYIDNFRVIPAPSCNQPTNLQSVGATETTVTISWTASISSPANGYQYYTSTTNTAPTAATEATGSVGAGILTATAGSLAPSSTNYIWVRSNCGTDTYSAWEGPILMKTLCDAPEITGTTPGTICGTGTAQLAAESTGTLRWYTASTGGSPVATGSTYTTPVLANTTTYYVSSGTQGTTQAAGKPAPAATATGSTTTNYGIVVNAVNDVYLESVSVYSTTAGTLNVKVMNAAMTQELFATGNVTIAAGGTTTPNVVPLGVSIPAGNGYRIVVKASSGVTLIRETSGVAFPYAGADGSLTAVSTEWGGTTTSSYYYFYDIKYKPECNSVRTAITATVTAATPITTSVSDSLICPGESTDISVTSTNADYTYTWTPGNLTGPVQTVTPAATTTYTVTAVDANANCTVTGTVTVTVNPAPGAIGLAETVALCNNNPAQALTSAAVTNGTILKETFNGTANNWVTVNNTTGGTSAAAAWTLRPDGYQYATYGVYHSNDNSQFYHTNGDAAGSGSTASTILMSPAFATTGYTSATVNFFHHFQEPNVNSSTGKVEASTDGTNWTTLQTYNSNTGTYGTFATAGIALPAAFVNQPVVYVRFKFDGAYRYFWAIDNVSVTGEQQTNVTWAPVTGLYTDAAATTAYAGEALSTVYAKPATGTTTTYTATAVNFSGCSVTDTVEVTVTDCSIGWGNVQWPANGTINTCGSHDVYARVWKQNVTEAPGQGTGIQAWIGVSTADTDPSTWAEADWQLATFNVQVENNDEFKYTITGLPAGTYYYASRFQYQTGSYLYGGFQGPWGGSNVNGVLTVNAVAAPTATAAQSFCTGSTVANLAVTAGDNIKWYADATGGTALDGTTALVDGETYFASQTVSNCESTARTEVVATVTTVSVTAPANVTVCSSYVLPALTTGNYFTAANGGGTQLAAGDEITETQTIYVFASSGTVPCTDEDSFTVTITNVNVADPADVTVCDSYELPELTTGNYYTEAGGQGTMIAAGTEITTSQTIYIYAAEGNCTDMEDFTVTVVPSPVADDPADVTECGSYALPALTVGNYYTAANGGGTQLNAGDVITETTVIYVRATAGSGLCADENSFVVTINTIDVTAPADVTVCNSYTLPELTLGNYYTAANGGGSVIPAGTVISEDATIYIYAVSSTTPSCTDEDSFDVNIVTVAQPTGQLTQTLNGSVAADVTIEDIVVNEQGVVWFVSEEDALAGTPALAAGTEVVTGNTYYGILVDGSCMSTPIAVEVTVVLGNKEFDMASFSYHPNPVRNVLTISYSQDITAVAVYNMLGQQVLAKEVNAAEASIDMSALADGTYVLNVTAGNIAKTIKIVKKQ